MLAYVFHFQPSELDNMDAPTLVFWVDRLEYIDNRLKKEG